MLPIVWMIHDEAERNFVQAVYTRYGKKIYKLAFQILKNREDAEDCLQDVMKKIMDDPAFFRSVDEQRLIALIVIRTKSTAIDLYRKNLRRRMREHTLSSSCESEEEEIILQDEDMQIEDAVISEETRARILALIGELKPIYRDVLWLRYLFDMSGAEIADYLHISENTVKVRLFRAKKILLETREEELDDLRKK